MKIHRLKQFANQLKINQTNAENRLWFYLKNRQMEGYKFRCQVILEGYIVDFVCLEKKLIIELDGSQHIPQWHDDNERTYKLNKEGHLSKEENFKNSSSQRNNHVITK